MKKLIVAPIVFAGSLSSVSAEPTANRADAHYHDLIVQSFTHAGFKTSALSHSSLSEKQMDGSDYDTLIHGSFHRAGMDTIAPASTCTKRDGHLAANSASCD